MFFENFYELDIGEKILNIYEKDSLKLIEEICLAQRFQKIVTCLGTKLRADSDQLSSGLINPDTTNLPSNEVSPFAIHLIDGSIMILWAETI